MMLKLVIYKDQLQCPSKQAIRKKLRLVQMQRKTQKAEVQIINHVLVTNSIVKSNAYS